MLWISLFLASNIKRRTWLVLAPLMVLVYGGDWYLHKYYPTPPTQHGLSITTQVIAIVSMLLIFGYYSREVVAPWHGAEHMAIVAYRKTGSTELDDISKESPVTGSCGGRFLIPMVIAQVLASAVLNRYMPTLAGYAVCLEAMLWADKFWGFNRIPGFAQATRLLQRYITTQLPDKVHMETAQRAIQELVAAHA